MVSKNKVKQNKVLHSRSTMSSVAESDVNLGLNEHHQRNLTNYMRFIRYVRHQNIRSIDSCFEDVKNSKLTEDTYTLEEVQELINDILKVVKIDIESEWLNLTHTNALLIQQLFSQAEKWHLKLQVDTSQLENSELLQQVKEFEERQINSSQKDRLINESDTKFHLEPMNECNDLLKEEINHLQEENSKLRNRIKEIESQASTLLSDRSKLKEDLNKIKNNLEVNAAENSEDVNQEILALNQQLTQTRDQLESFKVSTSKQEDLELNLTNVTHRLLQLQEQLEKKEKDLEAKINNTTAFVNLKKMLHQKNELLKSLRKKLVKYEPKNNDEEEGNEDSN